MQSRRASEVFTEELAKRAKLSETSDQWWIDMNKMMTSKSGTDANQLIRTMSLPCVISTQLKLPEMPSLVIAQFLIGVRPFGCKHVKNADCNVNCFSCFCCFNCNCDDEKVDVYLTSLASWRCVSRQCFVSTEVESMHNTRFSFHSGLKDGSLWFLAKKFFNDYCEDCGCLIEEQCGELYSMCHKCPLNNTNFFNHIGSSKCLSKENFTKYVYCNKCIYKCGMCKLNVCNSHYDFSRPWKVESCDKCDIETLICHICWEKAQYYYDGLDSDEDESDEDVQYFCRDCY